MRIVATGGLMIVSFTSDIATPVELSYTQPGYSGSTTRAAAIGSNSIILSGSTMTGTLSTTLGIPQILSGITLPNTVFTALKQTKTYTFDATPDAISFPRRTAVNPGSQVQFGPVTLTGFNMPITLRATV
jgi:hypothetical protein